MFAVPGFLAHLRLLCQQKSSKPYQIRSKNNHHLALLDPPVALGVFGLAATPVAVAALPQPDPADLGHGVAVGLAVEHDVRADPGHDLAVGVHPDDGRH